MLKRFLAFGPAVLVLLYGLWIGPKYDRYVLPAFDGFVYDAMADNPRVFTLAPWGYRILAPWIVHLIPAPSAAQGYFWLTLVCLAATLLVLHSWLRRLGFTTNAAALASFTLAVSPPIRVMLEYQVLVDPLSLFLITVILREFVSPSRLVLAALFVAGALTKEVCVLPLVALPFVLSPALGWRMAVRQSVWIGAPAIVLALVLRATWGPGLALGTGVSLFAILDRGRDVPAEYLGFGVLATWLGMKGLFRERSVELRATGALLWLGNLAAVLANPYGFVAPDLVRIAPFAWTPLLPLVLAGLGFDRTPKASAPVTSGGARVMAIAVMVGAAGLVLAADPYRRVTYASLPEPVTFLGRSRETLKTASLLEQDGTLAFDSESGRFAGPITQRYNLTEGRLHRWFLYEGFGPNAVFEAGAPEFRGEAQLLLPVMGPRTLRVSVMIEGPEGTRITASVSGRDFAVVNPGEMSSFLVPASALTRGDNLLTLKAAPDQTLRLKRFELRVEPPQ